MFLCRVRADVCVRSSGHQVLLLVERFPGWGEQGGEPGSRAQGIAMAREELRASHGKGGAQGIAMARDALRTCSYLQHTRVKFSGIGLPLDSSV